MKRLVTALLATSGVALASAPSVHAGNVADCEVMVVDATEIGAEASFRDAGPVVRSMLDPDTPIIAAFDGLVVQAVLCTRRDPIPDAGDIPLIASGIPFILSTDFDSSVAPLVTLALDADRRAIARMAVGLDAAQQERLDGFLAVYEPPERPETVEEVMEAEVDEVENASDPSIPLEEAQDENPENLSDDELVSALDDLLSFLGEEAPDGSSREPEAEE